MEVWRIVPPLLRFFLARIDFLNLHLFRSHLIPDLSKFCFLLVHEEDKAFLEIVDVGFARVQEAAHGLQ